MPTHVTTLLDRPVYGMAQVDHVLRLKGGTAQRWIDGYIRGGKHYPPVVRLETTESDTVTWGEFVEARLLAEYRSAGSSLQRMRPAIDELRKIFHPVYPLAHARPFLNVAGRELVMEVQQAVGLDNALRIVVVRNGQVVLAEPAQQFVRAADFGTGDLVERIKPVADIEDVIIDPLRQFGEPVVRSVRTEVIAEQLRAGETVDGIAELFSLPRGLVEAAIRYELGLSEAA